VPIPEGLDGVSAGTRRGHSRSSGHSGHSGHNGHSGHSGQVGVHETACRDEKADDAADDAADEAAGGGRVQDDELHVQVA
jgi:hypothetical protein